jgi:hypothetical protein
MERHVAPLGHIILNPGFKNKSMFFSYDYYSNNVKIINPPNSAELI